MLTQSARNYHALLAARALGRLSGLLPGKAGSPRCDAAAAALSALLTPALAAKLAAPDPKALLMHLNSSLLNPQVSKDNFMIVALCTVELVMAQLHSAKELCAASSLKEALGCANSAWD